MTPWTSSNRIAAWFRRNLWWLWLPILYLTLYALSPLASSLGLNVYGLAYALGFLSPFALLASWLTRRRWRKQDAEGKAEGKEDKPAPPPPIGGPPRW